MIFVYPAAISDNVDVRYLQGLIKTLELYYLHHIAEAVANGSIRFYITQNRFTGSFSDIKMECINWDYESLGTPETLMERSDVLLQKVLESEMKVLKEDDEESGGLEASDRLLQNRLAELRQQESQIAQDIAKLQTAIGAQERQLRSLLGVSDSGSAHTRAQVDVKQNEINSLKEKLQAKEKQFFDTQKDISVLLLSIEKSKGYKDKESIAQQKLDYDKEKDRARMTGGVTRMELDKNTLDLRPSAITVEANVYSYEKKLYSISSTVTEKSRAIPISVKIVPIRMRNVKDIYDTLSKDMYANAFSAYYKSATRSLVSKFFQLLNPVMKVFLRAFTKPDEFDVWRDMLLKKKGLVDASSIGIGSRFPSYQKFAASIVVLSVNDLTKKDMNFLGDASKVSQLHRLGWNSFAVMDDPDQILMFCSYFENGMCSKIPYSYLFFSLKASDLFKELDSLSKFTGRVIGNFKSRPIQVVENLKYSIKLREKNNRTFNKYLEIAQGKKNGS